MWDHIGFLAPEGMLRTSTSSKPSRKDSGGSPVDRRGIWEPDMPFQITEQACASNRSRKACLTGGLGPMSLGHSWREQTAYEKSSKDDLEHHVRFSVAQQASFLFNHNPTLFDTIPHSRVTPAI
jgi:hypothetical protein